MTSPEPADLAALLAAGERAAFHGPPATAVEPLLGALELATGRPAESAAASWLLGVAYGACGQYVEAFNRLTPLVTGDPASPELRLFGGLAAATVGSLHRQLGRHAAGREADTVGMLLVAPLGPAAFEAQMDCALGLAADAVGLGEVEEAKARLSEVETLVASRTDPPWRPLVRLGWVRGEVALLLDDPESAVTAMEDAVQRAEKARAPRHVAKGLLFLGVAQAQSGHPEAVTTLRRAATLAESLGTSPLVWPARAVLGALLAATDAVESGRCLAAARSTVLAIAADLPESMRLEWLARQDVAALLGG